MIPHLSVFTSSMVSLTGQHFSSTRHIIQNNFTLASLIQTNLRLTKLLFMQATMEEVFLRFPHLTEDIFNALDDKTFANCKEVSIVWYNNLDDQKFVQERRVRVVQVMIAKFQQDFQQKGQDYISNTPVSSAFDTAIVQTILNEAREGNFGMVHKMILDGFKKTYYPNSYHRIRHDCIFLLAINYEHKNVMMFILLDFYYTYRSDFWRWIRWIVLFITALPFLLYVLFQKKFIVLLTFITGLPFLKSIHL